MFYKQLFIRLLPLLITAIMFFAALFFIASFLFSTWKTIGATTAIVALQQEVARESLHRTRFDRVLERLKKKTEQKKRDWSKVRNPF